MENYTGIIMMAAMLAVMYFLMIRPESKRKKQEEKMRSELVVGDVIQTIGGVVGTICAIKDTSVVVETGADRVRIEFVKDAVAGKRSSAAEATTTK